MKNNVLTRLRDRRNERPLLRQQFRALVQSELQKWGTFVKQTGIKVEQ